MTEDEIAGLRRDAVHEATYSVLGTRLHFAGNDPSVLTPFSTIYHPLRAGPDDGRARVDVYFSVAGSGADRVVTAWTDREACRVTTANPQIWPFAFLVRFVLTRVRTHYLIHAGCVAKNGRGIVISGTSGMGKSTLVAHLAARGFDFLSDELAPIERHTRMVEPYPMRIGIRKGPGRRLIAGSPSVQLELMGDEKQFVDAHTFMNGKEIKRVPLHAVIFLTQNPTANVATVKKVPGPIRVNFLGWTVGLEDELQRLDGVTFLGVEELMGQHGALLKGGDLVQLLDTFKELAQRHGVTLVDVAYEDYSPSDYDSEPNLVTLPATAGVLELVKKIPTSCREAMMKAEFGGRASSMVMELSMLLRDTPFYKLTPGRLDDMLECVERIAP